jgi:hypothetical protein
MEVTASLNHVMKRMNTNYPEIIGVINENPSIQKAGFEPVEDDWFTAGEQWS